MSKIPVSESNAIVIVRVFAMLSIILCHLFQCYGIYQLSSIFNIGVQVFLVLSGYLYGRKTITEWRLWALRRSRKLYIPTLLIFLLAIPFYMIYGAVWGGHFLNLKLVVIHILNLQGLGTVFNYSTRINGLNHLWFMTAIMISYCSIPLLQIIRKYPLIAFLTLITLFCFSCRCIPTNILWGVEWLLLFSIGYLYVVIKDENLKLIQSIFEIAIMLASIVACIYIKEECLFNNLDRYNRIFHDFVGISLTIWTIKVLSFFKISPTNFVKFLDRHSFHIFLVHFPIMVGPFSLGYMTSNIPLNIVIMISVVIVCSLIFVYMINNIDKKLESYL